MILIRLAGPDDLPALTDIEGAADRLLIERFDAHGWPPPPTAEERAAADGFILVADDADTAELVGFAQVLVVDGQAHLEQLSVLPSHGRRGIGRRLVDETLAEAARRRLGHLTLRTYADVPWNAPFYASCGFEPSEPDSPFLRGLVDVERRLGIDRYGRRIQMTARRQH